MRTLRFPLLLALLLALNSFAGPASAQPGTCCVVSDNGSGTPDHPPACPNGYSGALQIVDGLPVGSTLDMVGTLHTFTGLSQLPGGTLGGTLETWGATLHLQITGTGVYAAYVRSLDIPISSGRTDSAPRIPFAILQSFDTELMQLQGQISSDPDFDLLRITAGTNFGLPGPGHTNFSAVVGGYAVDSYFDTNYRIDFVGHPGGPFGGRSGSTTQLAHLQMCHDRPTPAKRDTWGRVKQLYR